VTWTIQSGAIPIANGIISPNHKPSLLFLGDLHLDNSKTNRAAVKTLLDEAVARDALVVLLGDVFDVMQGYGDRRANLSALKKDYAESGSYLGAVLDDVTKFLTPYARNIWVMLQGNHESSVARFAGIRIEQLLAANLTLAGGTPVTPGYQTYAVVKLSHSSDNRVRDVPFWISHGYGGGGEVTKGVIQAQRRAVTYPDARFVISGHVHSSYYVAHEQWRLDRYYRPFAAEQEHYVVGTFKDEFSAGTGYHVEKGRGPRLPSGWWAKFNRKKDSKGTRFLWAFERAIP
jgi:predicted phosphodiesterase